MSRSEILLLLLCSFSVLLGCSSTEDPPAGTTPSQQDGPRPGDTAEAGAAAVEALAAAPALDEATLAGLASADALDGTADHVVSKCAGCKLMMDGKEEHSIAVGDYTLHLCSTSCRDHFVGDLPSGLAGLLAAVTPVSEAAAEKPAAEKPAAEKPAAEKPAEGHDHSAH